MSYFRANVETMVGYVPGEQPAAGEVVIKLNTNENPYPPSPRVREAILNELGGDAGSLRLYSDPSALALRRAASRAFGLPVGQILQGNGSDELLSMLFRAMVDTGDRVAFAYPTYSLYETLACGFGASIDCVPFDSAFRLPAELFGSPARLVFVVNPNAPSGTAYALDDLRRLAHSLPRGVLVVDEAYADFAESSALQLVRELPNVVVLRTLSKSYSLAGMRVGLLLGSEAIVEGLTKVKDSYNVDRLALVAAEAALNDDAWMRENVERIKRTRSRLSQVLREMGLDVLPSQANFVLVRLPSAQMAKRGIEFFRREGILVRYFDRPLLDDAWRITVGTDGEIDTLLGKLRAFFDP